MHRATTLVTLYFSKWLYGRLFKYCLYHFKGLVYFTIRFLYKLIKTLEPSRERDKRHDQVIYRGEIKVLVNMKKIQPH